MVKQIIPKHLEEAITYLDQEDFQVIAGGT